MTWIKCANGNVIDVPEDQVASLTKQGHTEHKSFAEAKKAPTPKLVDAVDEPTDSEPDTGDAGAQA